MFVTYTLIHIIIYGQNWNQIKDTIYPNINLNAEYDSAYHIPLSCLGWEDGLHISNDGLSIYCTYVPIDLLSFVLNGDMPNSFSSNYLRGSPTFGMNLVSNPLGYSEWLHSDILYSRRQTTSEPFNNWELSNIAREFYSEGAPTPVFDNNNEFILFTSNDNSTNNMDIWIRYNNNSSMPNGSPMPSPVNTDWNEDNPHLIRLSNDSLVLFFDSNDRPNGMGNIDIWYTTSSDNGDNWNTPVNVSSINTNSKEHQPFIFFDSLKNSYYIYYSTTNTDGKLAIFRRKQQTINNWNSWGSPELVVGAGNAAGVGEPTLTNTGDLYFVVVYDSKDTNSTYNRFDSDPWFLKRKNITSNINKPKLTKHRDIIIYPNPTNEKVFVKSEEDILDIEIINSQGILFYKGKDRVIKVKEFNSGIYYVCITQKTGRYSYKLVINN